MEGEIFQAVGLVFAIIIIELVKHWRGKNGREKDKTDKLIDIQLHLDTTTAIKQNTKTLDKLERYLSIAANEYTRTLPAETIKDSVERMFQLARLKIFYGVIDMLDDNLEWHIPRLREKTYIAIEQLVQNTYNSDKTHLRLFDYEGKSLATLMTAGWVKSVTKICKDFANNHYKYGNHFNDFKQALITDFEKINYEFIKQM